MIRLLTQAVTLVLPLCGCAPAEAGAVRYGPARRLCTLANRHIDESSGLVAGRRTPGVFWTHNDSGDRPQLYAFNVAGEHLATCIAVGARARDWEDLATFRLDGNDHLLACDTGDNARKRKSVTLYLLPEPELDPNARDRTVRVRVRRAVHFTYEDGPQDVEAVAADSETRTVYLVAKRGRRTVYALPWPEGDADAPGLLAARRVGLLNIPRAVAMDFSDDGRRAIILSYHGAHAIVRRDGETWPQAFARRPRLLLMPLRRQGESICYGPDGRSLYLTSEKLPTPLIEIPARGQPATRPAADPD